MWGGGRGVENRGETGNMGAGGFLSSFLRAQTKLQREAASSTGPPPARRVARALPTARILLLQGAWETGRGALGTEMRAFPTAAYRLRRQPSPNIRMMFSSRTQPQKEEARLRGSSHRGETAGVASPPAPGAHERRPGPRPLLLHLLSPALQGLDLTNAPQLLTSSSLFLSHQRLCAPPSPSEHEA